MEMRTRAGVFLLSGGAWLPRDKGLSEVLIASSPSGPQFVARCLKSGSTLLNIIITRNPHMGSLSETFCHWREEQQGVLGFSFTNPQDATAFLEHMRSILKQSSSQTGGSSQRPRTQSHGDAEQSSPAAATPAAAAPRKSSVAAPGPGGDLMSNLMAEVRRGIQLRKSEGSLNLKTYDKGSKAKAAPREAARKSEAGPSGAGKAASKDSPRSTPADKESPREARERPPTTPQRAVPPARPKSGHRRQDSQGSAGSGGRDEEAPKATPEAPERPAPSRRSLSAADQHLSLQDELKVRLGIADKPKRESLKENPPQSAEKPPIGPPPPVQQAQPPPAPAAAGSGRSVPARAVSPTTGPAMSGSWTSQRVAAEVIAPESARQMQHVSAAAEQFLQDLAAQSQAFLLAQQQQVHAQLQQLHQLAQMQAQQLAAGAALQQQAAQQTQAAVGPSPHHRRSASGSLSGSMNGERSPGGSLGLLSKASALPPALAALKEELLSEFRLELDALRRDLLAHRDSPAQNRR